MIRPRSVFALLIGTMLVEVAPARAAVARAASAFSDSDGIPRCSEQ